jgi:malonyl-ACP O-methyltransferase BioC
MANQNVIDCFSRSAESYDGYATIQQEVGRQLLEMLDRSDCATILELGCGTGNFTSLLAQRFAGARIRAVDVSPAMIQVAARKFRDRRVTLRVADAETMNFAGPHDLVAANASFHWFEDLPATVPKLARACAAEGTLLFSTFGPETYRELNVCLRERWGPDVACVAEGFPEHTVLEDLLRQHFQSSEVCERMHTHRFDCLWDLLRTIKYTGTQGRRSAERRFTRADMRKLEQAYLARFSGIVATYQVFYGVARGCFCPTGSHMPART